MPSGHNYARIEWERRFLLKDSPRQAEVTNVRRIVDLYVDGTRLRLRHMIDRDGDEVFKLTQKLPADVPGARQGLITTLYLERQEFEVLSALPNRSLSKVRYSMPPFGIDVFEGTLKGLVLAEAEFHSDEEAASLAPPSFIVGEVTGDLRFTGGILATATRNDLRGWLADFGIELERSRTISGEAGVLL